MLDLDFVLISVKYCCHRNKIYSLLNKHIGCEKDIELNKMLDNVRAKIIEIKEFIYNNPEYNGKVIYDYELNRIIKILGNAIVNLDFKLQ